MQLLYILGRQKAIGYAELEMIYGHDDLTPVGDHALVKTEDIFDFTYLGGSVKMAKVIGIVPSSDFSALQRQLPALLKKVTDTMPAEGKIKLGVSLYGFQTSPQKVNAIGLTLKKYLRSLGRSVRHVPNNELALSSAQVYHNNLDKPLGLELILVRDRNRTIIARTSDVQNIDSYTMRDRSRPKRDARVGMLPPKLAQIIINLAVGKPHQKKPPLSVLDPFCGTGVVLQESILMGYTALGSDLEQRMIDYSQKNLEWLNTKLPHTSESHYWLEQGDATSHQWNDAPSIDAVACETYLGRPFTTPPQSEILLKNRTDCDTIIRKFLENIYVQVRSDTPFCVAVPAWFVNNQVYHLKTLDYLEEIGYNRISFVHADDKDLIYHREGQIVGRELVVMRRK